MWLDWRIFTREWLIRAEREEHDSIDDGDRFISLWIAFNGWMRGEFGEDLSDRQYIDNVKKLEEFKSVFETLKTNNPNLISDLTELKKISVVDMRFRKREETIYKFDGTFESLIEVIYQIRCNLFHGRKDVNEDKKDIELVRLAYRILLPLFKKYLSSNKE